MTQTPRNTRSRILVALDGSPAAATALPVATAVAEQLQAELSVLHVPSDKIRLSQLKRWLHNQQAEHLPIHLEEAPSVHAGILRALADPRVELVVLTTHGRTIEPGRELGGVAEAVIAWSSDPILIVRPEAAETHRFEQLGRLLVPVDGSPTTAEVLRPASALAQRLSASIDLLYVVSQNQKAPDEPGSIGAPRYVDQPHHEWPAWAAEAIERLGCLCAEIPRDVPVQMFLETGEVGPAITRFAIAHGADAIVLARRSHLEPGRAEVLRAVLAETPLPVLLVGAHEAEFDFAGEG